MWIVNLLHLYFLSCLTTLLVFSNFTLFYCKSWHGTLRCPDVRASNQIAKTFEFPFGIEAFFPWIYSWMFSSTIIDRAYNNMTAPAIEIFVYFGIFSVFAAPVFLG